MMQRLRLRLQYVEDASFTQSEATMFENFVKKNKALAKNLKGDDVVLFRSIKHNILYWVFNWESFQHNGKDCKVLMSIKHRLEKGQFSELMIGDYAKEKGIHLVNFPLIHDYLQRQAEEKATGKPQREEMNKRVKERDKKAA